MSQSKESAPPRRKLPLTAYPLRDAKLRGWHEHIAGKWHYNDLDADPEWNHGWISFDALAWNRADQKLYCGLNAMDSDIFYRFDPAQGSFEGLEARRWADRFDVKIHRTLLQQPDGGDMFFATSLLHDADRQREAPGGKLVRYDWRANSFEVLGIPMPHLYIQSIAADWSRGLLYGFTYPAEFVFRFDLESRQSQTIAYLGNSTMLAQPHNAVVDGNGNLWGTYAETRAWDERPGPCPIRLFKYEGPTDRMHFFDFGLSRKVDAGTVPAELVPDPSNDLPDMTESRHKDDYGFCDAMAYDGDRHVYAGTTAGVLCRINTEEEKVEKIANVMPSGRCPALGFDAQQRLLVGGGMKGRTALARFDPGSGNLDYWDALSDGEGRTPARIHELAVDDAGNVWLAENDNHNRSSYLWRACLENPAIGAKN